MSRETQPAPLLRVLFVHPSYPNTFHSVMEALALRPGLSCACMVENRWRPYIQNDRPRLTYLGYDGPEAESTITDVCLRSLERWIRRGRAIVAALQELAPRYSFDVIVGSASSGCTYFLRQAVDCAIISYCEHPNFAVWAARKEFPPTFENHQYDIAYQSMLLTSVIHSDLGLVASRHARNLFPQELRAKVRVQSEAFELHPRPDDISALRQKLGLPAGAPLIGFFGRTLEAVRGFDTFLQVARQIQMLCPAARFLVIGAEQTRYGNELAYLNGGSFKQYALRQSGISESEINWREYLPYDQFLEHLFCLDLAILPTFEGASNWSFFDAMAAGVPILSSDRSYVPEVMRDGKEGFLFEPYDVQGFTRKALELLDQPQERRRIGRNAQKRIAQRFTPQHAADGYERIIREAHARNREAHARNREAHARNREAHARNTARLRAVGLKPGRPS